ncbi:MAG: type II secretion system F family protein [Tepidisphaeraceae bacterium]
MTSFQGLNCHGGALFVILVGLSIALFGYALCNVVFSFIDNDKRRLKNRLSNQLRTGDDPASHAQRSIRNDLEPVGLEGVLVRYKFFQTVDALLQLSFPELGLKKFLGIVVGCFFAVFMLMLAFTLQPIVALVAGVLAGSGPFLYLTKRKNARQRLLDDQLPDAMDFLGRALKAGHSLSTGLQMMGQELPQPIGGEFSHAFDQHSLGIPMEKVMRDMTRRVDSSDFAFFVTAVLIQRQTGGDLSEVLKNISGMIRQRIRLQQQVKAKTAEGRFTGYLLTAFPAVMFVITYAMNPKYGGALVNTSLGLQMLGAAFTMQILGLFVIRKITTVKV